MSEHFDVPFANQTAVDVFRRYLDDGWDVDRAFIVAVRYLAAYPSKYAELRELNAEYERVVYGGLSDENKTEGVR